MAKAAPRSFSSFGKVSRSALIALGAVSAFVAVTAAVVAHARTEEAPGESVDAARHVLTVAEGWRAEHADACPTISQLIEDGQLDASSRTDDAWGNRFRIVCDGPTAEVRSAGPDRRVGTADDLKLGHES